MSVRVRQCHPLWFPTADEVVVLRCQLLTIFNRGKPAGTNVSWSYSHETRVQNYTADDDGVAYKIKTATIKMDWSDWYKS